MQKKQTIESIAALCPQEAGEAVYKARGLHYLYNSFVMYYDSLCGQGQNSLRIAAKDSVFRNLSDAFLVYPNPTKGQLNIQFANEDVQFKLRIFNSIGKLVFTTITREKTTTLDLRNSGLSSGIYFIEAINDEFRVQYKTKFVYEK